MKKKIMAVALAVCILAIGVVSATMSYFTDTDTKTNTFTFGKVDIDLTETSTASDGVEAGKAYDENGNILGVNSSYDPEKFAGFTYDKVLPGLVYSKAPVIKNTGDLPAFIGFEIVLPGGVNTPQKLCEYFDLDCAEEDDIITMIEKIFIGFDKSKWDVSIGVKGLFTSNTTSVLQFVYTPNGGILAPNTEIGLFTQVKIPEKMEQGDFANFDLKINAYAAQTEGFTSAREAITEAGFNHN